MIKTYVDTFHGCYKDGLNGTRDCRALSGYSLVLVGLLPVLVQDIVVNGLSYSYTAENYIPQYVAIVYFTGMTVLCSLVQPYKQKIANVSAAALLANLAALYALSTGLNNPQGSDIVRVMILLLLSAPHCTLAVYVMWKIKRTLFKKGCNGGEREGLVHSNTTLVDTTSIQ